MSEKKAKKPTTADQIAALKEQVQKLQEDYTRLNERAKVLEARGLINPAPQPEQFPRLAGNDQ